MGNFRYVVLFTKALVFNFSLTVGQKQTLKDLAGRTNFHHQQFRSLDCLWCC